MKEAKDLMIGNLIQSKEYKIAHRINMFLGLTMVEVDSPYFDYQTDGVGGFDLVDLEPIPLTEEWLVKFGFEHSSNGWYQMDMGFNQYFDFLNISIEQMKTSVSYEMDELLLNEIKHVHQLQNLYKALTGEELTIKELTKEEEYCINHFKVNSPK